MSDIQFASGLTAFQAGDFQKAAKAFHSVLKSKPRHSQALHLMGLSCAQMGEWTTALDYLSRAANTTQQDSEIWRNYAIVALETCQESAAKSAILGFCRAAPTDADTILLLGAMAAERNLPKLAALAWQAYLAQHPHDGDRWVDLGTQYAAANEPEQAIQAFEKAAALKPSLAAPHANIGMLLMAMGRLTDAESALVRALDRQPDLLEALKALGNCFMAQDRHDRALAVFQRVATLAPDAASANQARQVMRTALVALKRFDDALADLCRSAPKDDEEAEFLLEHARLMIFKKDYDAAFKDLDRLAQLPNKTLQIASATAILDISVAVETQNQDRVRAAMTTLETLLERVAEQEEVWYALGNGELSFGRHDRARTYFKKSLTLNPLHSASLLGMGTILLNEYDYIQAEVFFRKAVAADPTNAQALNNIASCQVSQGYADDGMAALSAAFSVDPSYWIARSNHLFMSHFSDRSVVEDIFSMAKDWGRHIPPPTVTFPPISAHGPADKCLRVGFISADFRQHAVSYFFEAILKHRNEQEWQVTLYSTTKTLDQISHRLAEQANLWRDCRSMSDTELVTTIRNDNIDILFDLSGHLAGTRLPIFPLRPAPIQATWLGYFDTTGLESIDYLIADPISVTPSMEKYFTETILRMPHDFACYIPPIHAPDIAPLPAWQRRQITFGSTNQLTKLTDRVVATWTTLLHRVPMARLILQTFNLDHPAVRQKVADRFAAAGAPLDRLELRGAAVQQEILTLYNNEIDIALDPFPCVGGTTTCEALWMGVPVITLLGDRFCGRHSATHMTAVGLTETIAHTTDEYLDIAVRMASDLPALAELRANLRPRMAASPLVDAARFTADFEALLRQMWLEKRAR